MVTRILLTLAVLGTLVSARAAAAVKTKAVTYTHDGTSFQGFLAWDDAAPGKRPGVLVVHEWWGLNDYARGRARQLAALGFVAFAADMYGEGKTARHPKEAAALAAAVRQNVKTWQGRALAALALLKAHDRVDPHRLAAIGYCFGGSTVLELAYTGADLAAVVTFHGALPVPDAEQARAIKARVLICHGAADSFIPEKTIQQVRERFESAKVDYEMIYLGGAVHSFTVAGADKHGMAGIAYNPSADRRSWRAMLGLFREVFGHADKAESR